MAAVETSIVHRVDPPHRAISIVEVIDRIFAFNNTCTNYRCALVCRTWSDFALDHLWRDVQALSRLFGLLAPLKLMQDPGNQLILCFERDITPSDWKRFATYAKRVRSLFVSPGERVHGDGYIGIYVDYYIHDSVFTNVGMSRPSLRILPHLTEVTLVLSDEDPLPPSWHNYCLLFLHEQLRGLRLAFPVSDWAKPERFFDEMRFRCPNLTDLTLHFLPSHEIRAVALARLLSGLLCLKSICLPYRALSHKVLVALSALPNLENVIGECGRSEVWAGDYEEPFPRTGNTNSFPSLTRLALQGRIGYCEDFFASKTTPMLLRILDVEIIRTNRSMSLKRFLKALSMACPQLERLKIFRNDDSYSILDEVEQAKVEPIALDILRPLIYLRNLESLELAHTQPIVMSDAELLDLCTHCPCLTVLRLLHNPISIDTPTLTICTIALLARHCPKLKVLHLYLDATVGITSPIEQSEVLGRFSNLYFGTSPIDEPDAVAQYLCNFISPDCKMNITGGNRFRNDWRELPSGEELRRQWQGHLKNWMIVERKLSRLVKRLVRNH